jgi:hypothetical protein
MKSSLNLDQWADTSTMTPEQRKLMRWKPVMSPSGEQVPAAYYPRGTVFEGPQALLLCQTGQATPADKECMQALGKTPEECKQLAVEYEMNSLGVFDKKDRDLYRAGVIAGYNEDGTAKHGPNWEAYHEALAETESKGDI